MDTTTKLGGHKLMDIWKSSANNEHINYETVLNYEVKIPQKKKFLTYTDGEDRTPILRKHEDKVIRTRDALKRAGIPFRESNGHSYDKDYKHVPFGFNRIEEFRTIFEYTVTPEHYIN